MDMRMDARWCISQLLHSLLSFFLCISLHRYCCFLLCVVNNNSNKQQATTWVDNTKVMHPVRFVLCFLAFFDVFGLQASPMSQFFLGKGGEGGRDTCREGCIWLFVIICSSVFIQQERVRRRREKGSEKGERGKRERQRERGKRECVCEREREREREIAWRGIEPLRVPWCD